MKLALQQKDLISLAAGFTDSPSLPLSEIRAILDELWKEPAASLAALQYGSTQGDEGLRRWTRERIVRMDRLAASAFTEDQVVIGNGSQQLLALITEILCDPGDILLIEDPTYFVYLGIVQSCGLEAVPFLGVDELEQRLSKLRTEGKLDRVKLAYFVSYYRNPTGMSIPPADKKRIQDLIASYELDRRIYILEDAAYRDLRFCGEDLPSFLATDPALERTIYTATYTKPFATGLKVGYAILPRELVAPVLRFKGNEDFGTSHFDQKILARATAAGLYEKHCEQIARVYREKAAAMEAALKAHFPPSAQWTSPGGGLYYWVNLPAGADCGVGSNIFEASLAARVLYVPGELCYCDSPLRQKPRNQMRLSFGNASIEQIREGIKRLGEVLKSLL